MPASRAKQQSDAISMEPLRLERSIDAPVPSMGSIAGRGARNNTHASLNQV